MSVLNVGYCIPTSESRNKESDFLSLWSQLMDQERMRPVGDLSLVDVIALNSLQLFDTGCSNHLRGSLLHNLAQPRVAPYYTSV